MNTALMLLLIGGLLAAAKWREGRRKPPPAPADPLDAPLMWWSPQDPYSIRNLLQSLSVMGASGSGKSSSIGFLLAKSLAACMKTALLIIASKPEDREFWQGIAAAAGRELIVFGPGNEHRFNVIDFESKTGDSREITQCLMTISEILGKSEGSGTDPFWTEQRRRVLQAACEAVYGAYGKVDAWSLQDFLNGAAISLADLGTERWQRGYHNETLALASKNADASGSSIRQSDYRLAESLWLNEWPAMNDRTRTSILANVMGLLNVFNTGIVNELIGTESTITPEALDNGAWILVDMPIAKYGVGGGFVSGAWKYALQRHILRRKATSDTPVACLWIDEYQNHITSLDARYLAECRSHNGCMVVLTQSLHSFFSSIGGKDAQSTTKALLTNFGHKVFMTLGDDESAQYAASLVGRTVLKIANASMGGSGGIYDEATGNAHIHTGLSEHFEQQLQNVAFMHGLKTGGPECGYLAEGIVVKGGMPFSSGLNWIRVAFSQR